MADEETCEKKILSYGIFFSPFHVYKERKKTYFLMETRILIFFVTLSKSGSEFTSYFLKLKKY